MRRTLLALALAGCGPAVFGQTDDFPGKLKQGCVTIEACEQLATEAQGRVRRCRDNTIGYIRCSDARADWDAARVLVAQRERERDEQQRAESERRWQLQEQEATQRREAAARQRADEENARAQRLNEQRAEQERQKQQAEQAARQAELQRLQLLGPKGRELELRRCYRERFGAGCRDELLASLLEVATDETEKRHLAQLDQKLSDALLDAPEPSSAGAGALRCRDGTLSPTCVCGGPRRGCCSHHGGVAGCQ